MLPCDSGPMDQGPRTRRDSVERQFLSMWSKVGEGGARWAKEEESLRWATFVTLLFLGNDFVICTSGQLFMSADATSLVFFHSVSIIIHIPVLCTISFHFIIFRMKNEIKHSAIFVQPTCSSCVCWWSVIVLFRAFAAREVTVRRCRGRRRHF